MRHKKLILIILSLFLTASLVLTSGCLTNDDRATFTDNFTNVSQSPEDFEVKILEYYDHVNNRSSVITMNYSEIVARNYADIPTLIDTEQNETGSYCNFSMNLPLYNEIFLKNESVREMLRDGGLIVITYTDKARCTHPDNCDPCQWFNVAMDILYKGEWYEARIFNESNGIVDQIHHGGITDVPYSIFSF